MRRSITYAIGTVGTMVILVAVAFGGRVKPEKWYQARWCEANGGKAEVVLPDRTRCDCLTTTHAIEFDFGNKWTEAVGQSLYYAIQTGKRAGIVLIIEHEKDRKYWIRFNTVIRHYGVPIDVWEMQGNESKETD